MPIDYDLLHEIEQEAAAQETSVPTDQQPDQTANAPEQPASVPTSASEQAVDQSPGAPEQAAEQPTSAPTSASEQPEELPELEPMPGEPAADVLPAPAVRTAMPPEALALLGAKDEAGAMAMLEDIAVKRLTDDGVPEAAAREIISLRRQLGVGRARDEPPERTATPQPVPAAPEQPASAHQPAQATPQAQPATPPANSPAMERMAQQIEYIRARTGVDMLSELRANPELLRGVAQYSQGQGGMDIMGAYDRLRTMRAAARPHVPVTHTAGGGQLGGGHIDINRLTDEQIDEIDRRVRAGERVIL